MSRITNTSERERFWHRSTLPAAIALALVMAVPAAADATQSTERDTGAQQSDQSRKNTQNSASRTSDQSDGDASEDQAVSLEAVQVTATGRTQQVISVPYNISTVSGDEIRQRHVRDNAELLRSIPGVNYVDSGPRNSTVVNNIRMRGVNVDSSAMGDYAVTSVAPVATYVDSVPIFANFQLFDIHRVEVLRGPQGTLYGSGSLGGTVRYLFNKPQFDAFSGRVSASLSSARHSSSIGNSESAILNVPMADSFAMRINVKHNDYPGVTDYVDLYQLDNQEPVGHPVAPDGVLANKAKYYQKNDADTVRQDYGRVAFRFKPNDVLDMQLTHVTQADGYGSRRGQSLGSDTFDPPHHFDRNEIGSPQLEPSKRHVHMTDLEADIDMGFATLTSTTAHYNQRGDITSDNTGFYANNTIYNWFQDYYYYPREMHTAVRSYRDAAFTQELRLVSQNDSAFDYIVGLYYENHNSTTTQDSYVVGFKDWWDAAFPSAAAAVRDDNDFHYVDNGHYRESAIYGQGTWHATDALQFTVGARYFRDRYESDMHQNVILYSALHEESHAHNLNKNNKVLWLGNMSWWFSDSSQLYATVSEGYRRGGANAVNLGTPVVDGGGSSFTDYPQWLSYESDTVTNYEAGFKGTFGNLTYTADVFDTEWDDPQLNTSTTYGGYFAVENLGKARSRGMELDVQGTAGENVRYGAAYTYTDAKLREDAYTPDAGLPSRTVPNVAIDGLIAPKGTRLPGVSKNRLNAFIDYTVPVSNGALTFHLDGNYQSSSENSISQSEQFNYTLPGFTTWNASVNYGIGPFNANLWVKNLTDTKGATGIYKREYMGALPSDRMGHYKGNSSKLLTAPPRTVGLTLSYDF